MHWCVFNTFGLQKIIKKPQTNKREKGCWRAHTETNTCGYQPLSDFYKEQKIAKWAFSMDCVQLLVTGEKE